MTALAGKVAIVGGSSEGIGYAHRAPARGRWRRRRAGGAPRREAGSRGEDASATRPAARCSPSPPTSARRRIASASSPSRSRISAGSTFSSTMTARRRSASSMSFDDAAWDKAWQQNFMSVVRLTRGAMPAMREAGGGRIVNITALSALQPMPKFGLSVATWAGVIGYAKTLSLEVAAGQHHRQHDLPRPHRDRPARQGVRRRRRRARPKRCARGSRKKCRSAASASRDGDRRRWSRCWCRRAAATSPARQCMSTAAGGRNLL